MDDEDAQLMCRTRDGDPAAFAELFARWRVPIVRFAVRFVGRQAQGEELAQDVFLKIYQARDRYEPREPFRAYIFKVATHHCLHQVQRAESRNQPLALAALSQEPADAATHGADKLLVANELQLAVRDAVAALPPQQRAALLLQRERDLSLDEIAETLETTVSAVKSLLNRARKALNQQLSPFLDGGAR